jgi:murein DD-endopeptidase MepM/ murein hydrolase activator NlpD
VTQYRSLVAFFCGLAIVPCIAGSFSYAFAQSSELEKLQKDITERGNRLAAIEAEIAKFEAELKEVGAERKTLQSAINQLSLERKKIQAELAKTENLISSTDLEINKLILEISRTEADIADNEKAIAQIIRAEYQSDEESMIELLLKNERLSDFWSVLEAQEAIRTSMTEKVLTLSELKTTLEQKREESTEKRTDLVSLKGQYSDQHTVLANNQAEQADLLEVTKSEEKKYQQMLAEKQVAREQIIKELRDFEAKLQFILDPNTIPAPGTRVFDWPLKNIIITQYFGGTEFAKQNASVYAGRAYHPGVDFGTPRGTPIYAPLTGTVRDTGNTDAVPGCYSWGKWTLIDHANGLSTLYAHQDVISVVPGQKVSTGEIIGYSGNTGYSTGPHLHFTVYAKAGVSVRQFNEIKTVTSCGPAKTPVAASDAYIDPMLYLPTP